MTTIKKSLGDYLVDRTESSNVDFINQFYIDRNDDKIDRLLGLEQYLLEGNRGIGKTMLMKKAEIKADDAFQSDSILAVLVNFEESIRIERIKITNTSSCDPFLQWTMGKILHETLKKLKILKPNFHDLLNVRLAKIFQIHPQNNYEKYFQILEDYLSFLEKSKIDNNKELEKESPAIELTNILDNPIKFKDFLLEIVKDFSLKRIVFLFDEAAHVFSPEQQAKFFTLLKTFRNPSIACKTAVYPGITNYGSSFERGQDAKELLIAWSMSKKGDIEYIQKILKKRIEAFDKQIWKILTDNTEIMEIISICSNGNPRFVFHIIDQLESSGCFKKSSIKQSEIIDALRVVIEQKWQQFLTLKERLLKYKEHIVQAEDFIKKTIIPNLREWNNKKRKGDKRVTAGFYISTNAFDGISKIFDILDYQNIILIDRNKKSIGSNQYAYYISINPSILFLESVIKNVQELKNISKSTKEVQGYYESTDEIKKLLSITKDLEEYKCSNSSCDFKTSDNSDRFCPKCGNKIEKKEVESLYKILRSHPVKNLALSKKIIKRLNTKFNNIGQIYDKEIEDIKMKYIKDIRAPKVKNAVIEYMAG